MIKHLNNLFKQPKIKCIFGCVNNCSFQGMHLKINNIFGEFNGCGQRYRDHPIRFDNIVQFFKIIYHICVHT